MFDYLDRKMAKTLTRNLITPERPPLPAAKLEPVTTASDPHAEYARISKVIGFSNPHIDADLKIERFKAFLLKKDWTVFSLATVCEYMDKKAEAESAAKAGWHWRPLRDKDAVRNSSWGRAAFQHMEMVRPRQASDHYFGPTKSQKQVWNNGSQHQETREVEVPGSSSAYDKLVPLHALRKVAETEAEFKEPVSFFVCDYAPAPHIEHSDPFLMAVINNSRLGAGVGRFVIDFWDEPGFGLDKVLAP